MLKNYESAQISLSDCRIRKAYDLAALFGKPVEFTLNYRGRLPSGQNNAHKKLKREMRKRFHHRLRAKWESTVALMDILSDKLPVVSNSREADAREADYCLWQIGKLRFLPLVVNGYALKLKCDLEILIQSRIKPYGVLGDNGDLDNRAKTLIDALTLPQRNQLVDENATATDDPIYCLLQDDRLVSKITIAAEPLLDPPEPNEPKAYAVVQIRVSIDHADDSASRWFPV
jgi:hypothetical protein